MNKVAFIFRTPPHGSASGREGLDAVLATSALSEDIGVFFIDDGVYQLLSEQDPVPVLGRHYAPTFGLLELYDVDNVYISAEALAERGVSAERLVIEAAVLSQPELQRRLADYKVRLSF
ncbi:sulfurtransferase complex subunit TusC [Oceanisphaera arctica]|uniref:Sulfurtransferase TusC n=1 Tax=Oceanisphaera arctica TaxID=641510 RepID=A0A2P5TNG6_9GAMM|nr:sulfurtransferase complex subunit TusC [Oceanisphaera arctica]PPL17036.1 sulfurtransferase TusC [Oceanisphaera arctica]GHA07224.1 protein TusC [Oceanisphaera arctica]